jgi:hypothetical protein
VLKFKGPSTFQNTASHVIFFKAQLSQSGCDGFGSSIIILLMPKLVCAGDQGDTNHLLQWKEFRKGRVDGGCDSANTLTLWPARSNISLSIRRACLCECQHWYSLKPTPFECRQTMPIPSTHRLRIVNIKLDDIGGWIRTCCGLDGSSKATDGNGHLLPCHREECHD